MLGPSPAFRPPQATPMDRPDLDARTALGTTGVSIPPLCFGTSALGDMPNTYGYGVDAERAHATLRRVLEGPMPFLDTSRNYGSGRSEARVGEVLRELGGLPAGAVLSTKLDRDPDTNRFDAARARRSLEQSLEALGLSRVQILHLHDPEHADGVEEIRRPGGALDELRKLRDEGLCDAIGLAAGDVEVMRPIVEDNAFDVMITHNRFTLVNRNAESLIDLARGRGVAIMNAAPYAGGVFAKGSEAHPRYVYQEAGDATLEPVRRIEALCREHGVAPGAVALQFSMTDPRVAATVCGVSRPERVDQTLEWARGDVPDALWDVIAELPVTRADPEASRVIGTD